jgi:hypothetical protein
VPLVALAIALLAAAPAAAKEGAQAHLIAPLPAHPVPGSLITVRWTVTVPGASKGTRVGFSAVGMFVRLIGVRGAATTASAREAVGPPYSARIRVPRGGIRKIRFGLSGYGSNGPSNIFFPLR